MKKFLFVVLSMAFLCVMIADANAGPNGQAKWALHYAGEHNSKINTCALVVGDCIVEVNENAPPGPGRF